MPPNNYPQHNENEIDAIIDRGVHQVDCGFIIDLRAECNPRPQ